MPMYSFSCGVCQHSDTEYMPIAKAVPIGDCIECPTCGHKAYRRHIDLPNTPLTEFDKPIEMYSVGCRSDEEIREIQKKCPDVKISDDPDDELYGVPVVKNRHEKLKVLKAVGYVEIN